MVRKGERFVFVDPTCGDPTIFEVTRYWPPLADGSEGLAEIVEVGMPGELGRSIVTERALKGRIYDEH